MAQLIRDIMTINPKTLPGSASALEAAKVMSDEKVGAVIVTKEDGSLEGIITDRDLVVRCLARDQDASQAQLASICSANPVSLSSQADVTEAIRVMSGSTIRRLPVIEDGLPIGIVTLGDLAQARDPDSALGSISSAPAQN